MTQIEKPSTTAIAKGFVKKSLYYSDDEAIIANLLFDSTEEIKKNPCLVSLENFADSFMPSDEGARAAFERDAERIGKFPFLGEQYSTHIVFSHPLNLWLVRRVTYAQA